MARGVAGAANGIYPRRGSDAGGLFPTTLDDWIPEDHFGRVRDGLVDRLDMEAAGFVRAEPADTGRPSYDLRDLLKLLSYGYFHQSRSSRPAGGGGAAQYRSEQRQCAGAGSGGTLSD